MYTRANELLVSIPKRGRTSVARQAPTQQQSSQAIHEFATSTPLLRPQVPSQTSSTNLREFSTPHSVNLNRRSHNSDAIPSSLLVHKHTKPRVSLGDFHDQLPDLIDVEHDLDFEDENNEDQSMANDQISSGSGMLVDQTSIPPIPPLPSVPPPPFEPFSLDQRASHPAFISDPAAPRTTIAEGYELESQVEAEEHDTFTLAKCYFDSKELERCKQVLQPCRSKKSIFLRLYSVYLVSWRFSLLEEQHTQAYAANSETMTRRRQQIKRLRT